MRDSHFRNWHAHKAVRWSGNIDQGWQHFIPEGPSPRGIQGGPSPAATLGSSGWMSGGPFDMHMTPYGCHLFATAVLTKAIIASRHAADSRSHVARISTSSGFRFKNSTQFCTQLRRQPPKPAHSQMLTSHWPRVCKPQVHSGATWSAGRSRFEAGSGQRVSVGATLRPLVGPSLQLLRLRETSRHLPRDARECSPTYAVTTSVAPSTALWHTA